MADKYLLQVTAGPSYDEKTHQIVKVNEPTPLQISSPLIDANVTVRIQNYRGLPRRSPKTSPYFSHATHTHDQYSIAFSFIPKKTIPGADLVFGNDFDHPVRDKLPPGFSTAFKIVKWAIDPGLDGDPYADEPYLYGPGLSSWNIIRVGGKNKKLPEPNKVGEDVITEGADGDGDGEEVRKKAQIPTEAAARKKYFLDESKRKEFEFEEGRMFEIDFFNPYLDFNEFALKLPGFSLPIIKIWESKRLPMRYVLKNRETKEVYFVVVFTLLVKEEVEKEEANEETEISMHNDGEGAFQIDDDDGGVD